MYMADRTPPHPNTKTKHSDKARVVLQTHARNTTGTAFGAKKGQLAFVQDLPLPATVSATGYAPFVVGRVLRVRGDDDV